MEKIPTRLNYLDSLRGLAAFGVVFCHLACVFWNALYYEENAATVFEQIWNKTPLNAITNGNLPVQFFFVLSGFLITKNIYTRNTTDGFRVLGKKFTNLLKLVIPGILLPFLLMRLHLMVHQAALAQDESLVFVKYYNNFSPTLGSALSDFFYTFTEKATITVQCGQFILSCLEACSSRSFRPLSARTLRGSGSGSCRISCSI